MSWQIVFNNLNDIDDIDPGQLELLSRDNPEYAGDARCAFQLAKELSLVSASLSGGRTPSPYGASDTVVISIVGYDSFAQGHAVEHDFYRQTIDIITAGPDE